MARWRQRINEDGSSTMVPVGDGHKAPTGEGAFAVHGDIQPFVSPIDGTVISDRKQYREHCKKHDVVPATEFSAEHYQRAAEQRARLYTGNNTKEETFARRAEMYEVAMQMERKNGR